MEDLKETLDCKEPVIETPKDDPYANDLFGREGFGNYLQHLVDLYAHTGAVIALNGEWGSGKTTFLNMWNKNLQKNRYRTLFFNAWENDYHEDPMIALMGELAASFSDKEGFDKAISIVGRLCFSFAGCFTKGVLKKFTGIELDELVDVATGMIVESVRNYHEDKNIQVEFKRLLSEFVADPKSKKPVVFIIDELDRCNPQFAVKLLERLKHIFEVPNIIFVVGEI